MTTVLQYLVIAAVIGLALFGLAMLLFGRGEQMAALPARTSPARLPDDGVTGADVRKVRFALALRGYRMSDVDWTLDRLADELDRARTQLVAITADSNGPTAALGPDVDPPTAEDATEVADSGRAGVPSDRPLFGTDADADTDTDTTIDTATRTAVAPAVGADTPATAARTAHAEAGTAALTAGAALTPGTALADAELVETGAALTDADADADAALGPDAALIPEARFTAHTRAAAGVEPPSDETPRTIPRTDI